MKIFRCKDRKLSNWEEYSNSEWTGFDGVPVVENDYTFCVPENKKIDNIIFSYDEGKKKNNFHITYKEGSYDEYSELDENCNTLRLNICRYFEDNKTYKLNKRGNAGRGTEWYTKGHRWVDIDFDGFNYMISFQSLSCCKTETPGPQYEVSCDMGQIQFIANSKNYKGPNFDENGKFKMMYPEPGKEKWDEKTYHRVKNTRYKIESLLKNEKEILKLVKDFVAFVNHVQIDRGHEDPQLICDLIVRPLEG